MWPSRKKKEQSGEVLKALENLQVKSEDRDQRGNPGLENTSSTLKRTRGRFDLSPEEAFLLQKDVFKRRDADQEALEKLLKAITRLVRTPESPEETKGGTEDLDKVEDLFE